MIGIDEISFPHNLLLTNRQVAGLYEAFASNLLKDIKLSRTQISKLIPSGGFVGRLVGQECVGNIRIAAAAVSAADTRIHKNYQGLEQQH